MLKLESALDAMVSERATRLGECVIQLQERVRAEIGSGEQYLGNTTSRFEDSLTRRLQRAHEAGLRGVNRRVEGTRKHLTGNEERFQRWAVTLRGAVDKAFDSRAGLLATTCILLEERMGGGQADGQRELDRRKNELLATVDRIVFDRQKILDLKPRSVARIWVLQSALRPLTLTRRPDEQCGLGGLRSRRAGLRIPISTVAQPKRSMKR